MNSDQLNLYMFQIGSKHNAVKVIKSFLNSHSAVSISDLGNDSQFDSKTEEALKSFQESKQLQPTGTMNLTTWLAIGAEMNPVSINVVAMGDSTLRDLLQTGCRSKFPFKKISSNNSFDLPVRISPSNLNVSGSYKFTFLLYVSIFAPFDWFGPLNLSRGDKASRRFTTDPKASYRLRSFSTVTATPIKNKLYSWVENYAKTEVSPPTKSYLWMPWNRGNSPVESRGSIRRGLPLNDFDGYFREEIDEQHPHRLHYQFKGNDDAFAFFGANSWFASDIDVHPDIQFEYSPDKKDSNKVKLRAFGSVIGDQFPCVETYIVDKNSNGVMLGIWQIREGDGPVTTREGKPGIIGDKRLPMINFDITIIVENGIFTGVEKDGRIVSLAEHNKPYLDSSPVVAGTPLPLEKPRPATHY